MFLPCFRTFLYIFISFSFWFESLVSTAFDGNYCDLRSLFFENQLATLRGMYEYRCLKLNLDQVYGKIFVKKSNYVLSLLVEKT